MANGIINLVKLVYKNECKITRRLIIDMKKS